jgi:nucleoprotein TPR
MLHCETPCLIAQISKFKIDSITQQLQLSQAEAERNASELTLKTEEFAKYRRSKHAELGHLQSTHDTLVQTFASTESTLKALQSAHTAQTHQYTQALARVQDLTGQLAEQEAIYSSEASGLRRLVAMMEEREKQAKEIVEGIEREWAGVGDRAERREAVLREDIENERRAREQAERRVEQLESVLSRIDSGELPLPGRASNGRPATPVRTPGTPDPMMQGMMGLSPTVAMASKAQRGGKTFTEVYGDYIRLQDELAKKSAECDHMDRTLSSVLAQIEERVKFSLSYFLVNMSYFLFQAPILSQQRVEYERLQSEAAQLASQLAQALADRDAHANLLEDNSQKLKKSARENELLQKQLDDLGRQVQALLKELGRRDDSMIPLDEELDQMFGTAPAENIEAVITNNLVLFRSIGGLQEQNQKLLKIVRELGAKMEAEERDYKEMMEKEQGEAVREAHEAIQELLGQLERQKKSSEATIQAYMKERDALRSMLNRAERAGMSKGTMVNGVVNGFHEEAGSDLAKELAEIQDQFETYKTEMGVDSVKLREEVLMSQREAGQLGAALAKANAKIEYMSGQFSRIHPSVLFSPRHHLDADRHRMLQDELSMQGRELDNLRKRNQQLDDQFMRADIACNHALEDLVEARSQVEQLRNEGANLRAEKKIWEVCEISFDKLSLE